MTFNTSFDEVGDKALCFKVLNLVINGWPSILYIKIFSKFHFELEVLNLVINGWPSIL